MSLAAAGALHQVELFLFVLFEPLLEHKYNYQLLTKRASRSLKVAPEMENRKVFFQC